MKLRRMKLRRTKKYKEWIGLINRSKKVQQLEDKLDIAQSELWKGSTKIMAEIWEITANGLQWERSENFHKGCPDCLAQAVSNAEKYLSEKKKE